MTEERSEEMVTLPNLLPPRVVLTIAGLDPSCGAGITADLKTFAAHGLYGICCPTALTVQSTRGVRRSVPVDPALVTETLEFLTSDIRPDGIKIGMLGNAKVAAAVADFLHQAFTPRAAIVLDPVLRSSSGAALLDETGLHMVRERLLAHVGWITPNVDELSVLVEEPLAAPDEIPSRALRLQQLAAQLGNDRLRVVVTGGHLEQPDDFFLDCLEHTKNAGQPGMWLRGERVETTSTHGTGCAFSSALACEIVSGYSPLEAVTRAKAWVTSALRHAYPIGSGKGPMHHFFACW